MNKDTILGVIRHALTFGGGLLVARGLVDSGQAAELAGALVSIIGVTWSIIAKRKAVQA